MLRDPVSGHRLVSSRHRINPNAPRQQKCASTYGRINSFAYKGRAVDVKQVGRELGVRYVLEGSVRKSGDRVRITTQLIEAETGRHLWAERYDRPIDDIFALQDEITLSVVGAIEPSLRSAEVERAKRKRPDNLGAYDPVSQALPDIYSECRSKRKKHWYWWNALSRSIQAMR
jgi:hypothetical protein